MNKKSSSTKIKKANSQPKPEGGPEPAPESPAREARPLREKAADRTIAKKEGKKTPKEKGEPEEDLVVFAFRLTADEREAIHNAAGPAKASRFVRTLAVAAARKDKGVVNELIAGIA